MQTDPSAINAVKQQIQAQSFLRGRRVGIVIAYGGAPDDNQIARAQAIAQKIYSILQQLGQQGFAFQEASYYDPLYILGNESSLVILDLYLFAE